MVVTLNVRAVPTFSATVAAEVMGGTPENLALGEADLLVDARGDLKRVEEGVPHGLRDLLDALRPVELILDEPCERGVAAHRIEPLEQLHERDRLLGGEPPRVAHVPLLLGAAGARLAKLKSGSAVVMALPAEAF